MVSLEMLLQQAASRPASLRPSALILGGMLPPDATRIIEASNRIVAVDSGADRLRSISTVLPEALIGDLDSLSDESRKHYESKGVPLFELPADQDSTDLQKALQYLTDEKSVASGAAMDGDARTVDSGTATGTDTATGDLHPHGTPGLSSKTPDSDPRPVVFILGGLDGRLDHTLQNLNTALMWHDRVRMLLVSEQSVVEVLPPGHNAVGVACAWEGHSCGLLPLGGKARAKTTGLQYPCDGLEMQWGGLLSTSNKVVADEVKVESDQPLLWIVTRCGTKGSAKSKMVGGSSTEMPY